MLRVRCQAEATLDAKGRLALPAPLRRAMAAQGVDQLVLTFYRGAVWGWTPDEFERSVEAPLGEADPFNPSVMDFAHALLAPAQDVEVDRQGRIRVPPLLRELAGLDREITVNSLQNRIELWDRGAWTEHFKASLQRAPASEGLPRGAR